MTAMTEIRDTVQTVAASAGPAVVGIGRRGALGSGVVVDAGRVLTNAHNVRGDRVIVGFAGGRTETGTVAGVDVDADVAVVTVDTGDIPPIPWADAPAPGIGEPVVGLANPGGRGLRVTIGYVSGTDRSFRGPRGRLIGGSIEHTAPLLPGSSGGPLVDTGGRLVGLNTNRLGEGFYLAIPADDALRTRVERLAEGRGTPSRRLGIGVVPPAVARGMRRAVGLEDVDGVLVRMVEDTGPAGRAGVREGDLIVGLDGTPVTDLEALYAALDTAGDRVELEVVRGVERLTITASFEAPG